MIPLLQGIQGHEVAHIAYTPSSSGSNNNNSSANPFGDYAGEENYPPPGSGSASYASAPPYSGSGGTGGYSQEDKPVQGYDEEESVGV